MIRTALQRPGRLRMRLTVVAAASAAFVLVVLAALVLPSLQHNLEQSRVSSLRSTVETVNLAELLRPFSQSDVTPALLQGIAGTLGVGRITVFTTDGFTITRMADSAPNEAVGTPIELVQASARLHQNVSTVKHLPGGRTAILTFYVSSQGVNGVVLVEAPLRDVQEQVSAVERRLAIGGAFAFLVALIAGALAAEPLARRLARLRAAADRIARGSFAEPIVDRSRDEIGDLARSLDSSRPWASRCSG
jgi:HAMP domain-containing protein